MRLLIPLLFASAITMNAANAQDQPQTPAANSPERKAILDAARAPAESDLGKPVQFVVKTLNATKDWAFLHATMQGSGGAPIDYAGTKYAEAAEHGHKSDNFAALLKHRGDAWVVLNFVVGPTDVAWTGWADEYGAPATIFTLPAK